MTCLAFPGKWGPWTCGTGVAEATLVRPAVSSEAAAAPPRVRTVRSRKRRRDGVLFFMGIAFRLKLQAFLL